MSIVNLISIPPDALKVIAYCARVSNPANQENHDTAPRLLAYCARKGEWSPFEMVSMTLEIETTRDIARQILRHRSFSFQEFSQRYAEVTDKPVFRAARLQDSINRQSSIPVGEEHAQKADSWARMQRHVASVSLELYREALAIGIAKECARALLPEGLTPSRLYMAGTVRSWIHYVQLRTKPETQKEHREIAEKCRAILLEQLPILSEII